MKATKNGTCIDIVCDDMERTAISTRRYNVDDGYQLVIDGERGRVFHATDYPTLDECRMAAQEAAMDLAEGLEFEEREAERRTVM